MLKHFSATIIVVLFFIGTIQSQNVIDPPFISAEAEHWADSVMQNLNRQERIAQLIMISTWSNKDAYHINDIRSQIMKYGVGGLVFFQGGPMREALLTNDYQKLSKVPLLIGMDAEWGVSMRLDSTVRLPRQMTMSAIQSDSAVYKMGEQIAKDCNRLGIHVNFAPDADINNNPLNPVIGSRAFGDERESVAEKSKMYMNALQDYRVLPTAKHFPGHGNVDSDSHFTLPILNQDSSALDSVELYPFKKMIASGLGGVMVAHLNVPSVDSTPGLPSTLSKPMVTSLLKEKMGFKGLIFTDAMNMKGVSNAYPPGVVDKLALLAGNDILLLTEDVGKALREIHFAIENCEITEEDVNARVKKVLMAKYWCGLDKPQFIDTTNILRDLNSPESILLQRELYEKAVTVLENKDSLLPFRSKKSLRIASVVIGDVKNNPFQQQLAMYGKFDMFSEEKDAPVSVFNALFNFLSNYDYVILSLHGTTMKAQTGYGITDVAREFIDSVLTTYKTVFVDFGNAYTLSRFSNLKKAKALILGYEDFALTHSIAAQIIMGGVKSAGRMPVNSTEVFPAKSGVTTGQAIRFNYTSPEAVGMSSVMLNKIDSIVAIAIKEKATPGCQVLVARHGKVVYQKSFGTTTYDYSDTINNSYLYDVASITKIAATALGTMRLYEKKKINLNYPVSRYLHDLRGTNKEDITLKEILTHQAGLQPWIPFYKETITENGISNELYSSESNESHNIQVAECIFILKSYPDTIQNFICLSPMNEKGKYVYSDLGPILMKDIIEDISGEGMNDYVEEFFYKPLNLTRIAFNPLKNYYSNEIVPTENDTSFRSQLVHGYVHDPAAAMLGGVSGNAGLFSNANDLAVIMQMLLNKGTYGGHNFLKPSTVELFTKQQYPQNRRGLLFDKPETDPAKKSPCSPSASPSTFGHQGFTGTCAWADPEYDLIYIFLSNRIHPDVSNDKLIKMNVRTDIQEIIYQSILDRRVGLK